MDSKAQAQPLALLGVVEHRFMALVPAPLMADSDSLLSSGHSANP